MSPLLPIPCWRWANERLAVECTSFLAFLISDCLAFGLSPAWRFNFLTVEDSLKFITYMLKCWCICFCACYLDDWNVLQWCSYQPYSAGLPGEKKKIKISKILDTLLVSHKDVGKKGTIVPKTWIFTHSLAAATYYFPTLNFRNNWHIHNKCIKDVKKIKGFPFLLIHQSSTSFQIVA